MVSFWDTSALIPLFIKENTSPILLDLREKTNHIIIWTLTPIEIFSTLMRLQRMKQLSDKKTNQVWENWQMFQKGLSVVNAIEEVKKQTERVLRLHALKSSDALQLAAALIACLNDPSHLDFVTLDKQLFQSAYQEGFKVYPAS